MLRLALLIPLLTLPVSPLLAQSSQISAPEGGATATAAPGQGEVSILPGLGSTIGAMVVSDPLAAVSMTEPTAQAGADDGVPYLPVEDLCAAEVARAVNVTTAYTGCMEAETEAYDRIAAGLPIYETGLLGSCEAATRAAGAGYLSLLACLEPGME